VNFVEFVPYAFQILAVLLAGYESNVQPHEVFSSHFENFLNDQFWQSFGNIRALSILMNSYCKRFPALVINSFNEIARICEILLNGGRSHRSGFMIFNSIIENVPPELSLSCLPQIIGIAVNRILKEGQEVTRYDSGFSVFMSNTAFILGPENTIPSIPPEMIEEVIVSCARGLKYVFNRVEMENAVRGTLKVLTQGTLELNHWFELFRGLMLMMKRTENTYCEYFKIEDEVFREEEERLKEFDSSFSQLRYAELVKNSELDGVSLVRYIAMNLSEFSEIHPGIVRQAIEALSPELQTEFSSYPERFGVEFV
jgi:hypothetical protein